MPAGRCEARDMLREARSMLDHDRYCNTGYTGVTRLSGAVTRTLLPWI